MGIMETEVKPKRTYQKHKTEKKITVKHYLNKKIIEYDEVGRRLYPLYVFVTYNRKTTSFRSHLKGSYDENIDFNLFYDVDENHYLHGALNTFGLALENDENIIKWIISERTKYVPEFDIHQLPRLYHNQFYSLDFFTEWCLKREIQELIFNSKSVKFKYGDSTPEYDLGAIRYTVPIMQSSTAQSHFDFYVSEYPFINSLKEKYSSKVWNLELYIGIMCKGELAGNYWDIMGSSENTYCLYDTLPTLIDFENRVFQKIFLSAFNNEQFAKDIIIDIEYLFIEHLETFKRLFIQNYNSSVFDKIAPAGAVNINQDVPF
jgi:hypothetical protein